MIGPIVTVTVDRPLGSVLLLTFTSILLRLVTLSQKRT